MINHTRPVLISLLLIVLTACSGDNNDLSQYIHSVKMRKTRAILPIPTFAALPGFKFPEDDNRRNPFKPTSQKKLVDPFTPDQRRVRQVLEAYPLDSLKFVGTLTQDHQIWGLIKQPSSQISRVRVGDYMGQNYGRISVIKNNSIKLEETIKSASGAWEKHMTTLELYTGN